MSQQHDEDVFGLGDVRVADDEESARLAEFDEDEHEMMLATTDDDRSVHGAALQEQETRFADDSVQGFFKHEEAVLCVARHPTLRDVIASGGQDDRAFVWNAASGATISKLPQHPDSVNQVAWNYDGTLLATACMDGSVRIFRFDDSGSDDGSKDSEGLDRVAGIAKAAKLTETGELPLLRELEGPGDELTCLQWHPRGNVLLAGGADSTTWMWGLPSGRCLHVFAGHAEGVTCGGFTPDGKQVWTASSDGELFLHDPKSGGAVWHATRSLLFNDAAAGPVTCAAFRQKENSPALLLLGNEDASASLLNLESRKVLLRITGHQLSVEAVGFSNTHEFLAVACLEGMLSVWDTSALRRRVVIKHPQGSGFVQLRWHASQPWIWTAALDGSLHLWDARDGTLLRENLGHQAPVLAMDLAADMSNIVTGSDDHAALVFEAAPWTPEQRLALERRPKMTQQPETKLASDTEQAASAVDR